VTERRSRPTRSYGSTATRTYTLGWDLFVRSHADRRGRVRADDRGSRDIGCTSTWEGGPVEGSDFGGPETALTVLGLVGVSSYLDATAGGCFCANVASGFPSLSGYAPAGNLQQLEANEFQCDRGCSWESPDANSCWGAGSEYLCGGAVGGGSGGGGGGAGSGQRGGGSGGGSAAARAAVARGACQMVCVSGSVSS
jgi:hypothetical protein